MKLFRVCRDAVTLAAAALSCAGSANAQRGAGSIDVGAIALRYADTVNATAAALTPDLRLDWSRGTAEALGTLSQFAGGGWSAQGVVSSSLFTPGAHGFFAELTGTAGGSTHQDATRTGEALADARIHFARSASGVFAGGGGGTTWDGSAWRRVLIGEIGVWADLPPGTALLRVSPESVADSVRYVDGQLTLTWTRGRLDVSALAATRWGSRLPFDPSGTRSWASVNVSAWATPTVAIVGAGGTYPVDPTRGFPSGRFVSLGIRVASTRRIVVPARESPGIEAARPDLPGSASGVADVFRAGARAQGVVLLSVHAPSASRVEINGDFTGWTPVDLQRTSGGWWTRALPLAPGKYEMNLRVDGGGWVVPPGLLGMKDEFGGLVGLLIVE